jgi:hypothetical protein
MLREARARAGRGFESGSHGLVELRSNAIVLMQDVDEMPAR